VISKKIKVGQISISKMFHLFKNWGEIWAHVLKLSPKISQVSQLPSSTPKGFQEACLHGEHSYTLPLIILFSEMLIFFSEMNFFKGKKRI